MRSLLLSLSLLISLDAFAQLTATITASSPTVPTGGTVSFTAIVRNNRTTTFPGFGPTVQVEPGRIVSFSGPNCEQTRFNGVRCFTPALAPGEAVTIEFTVQATNAASRVGQSLVGNVLVIAVLPDHELVQVSASASVSITASPAQVDLGVAVSASAGPQPLDSIERVVTVTNAGPAPAVPVTVTLDTNEQVRLVEGSAPWTCTTGQGTSFSCTIASLGAGARSDLRLRFAASLARTYTLVVNASTREATDPVPENNVAIADLAAGTAASFARVLVPVLLNETPAARATWSSTLTAMPLGGPATVYLCTGICLPGDVRRLASESVERLWPYVGPGARGGAMLYTERESEPRLVFGSRVSSSRSTPSRGVELPIVRETEFRTDRLVIPAILLHASHRFMLRIYDPDAVPGSTVRVRLFQGRVDRVLDERTITLETKPDRVTPASLPAYPGYAEIGDLFDRFIPAGDTFEVGIEITGLRGGQKLWAFVSATENEGEHVTLIRPQ